MIKRIIFSSLIIGNLTISSCVAQTKLQLFPPALVFLKKPHFESVNIPEIEVKTHASEDVSHASTKKQAVAVMAVNQGSDDGTHMVSGGLLYAENSKTSSSRGTKRVSEIIDNANANSKKEPTLEDFQNAVVVYTFEENVMYSIFTSPGHISDIRFQKGETIISLAAGDTKNWLIEHALAGDRPHLLIKPMHSGLSTNLTVITDKRTYWFYLKSWKTTFMPGAEFHYPQDELMKNKLIEQQSIYQTEFQIEDLSFDYVVESKCGDAACLKPKSVFSDVKNGKLHLIMPESIKHASLPALFALDPEGNATMINYRFVDGKQFVLDTIYDMLMLEYGGGDDRRVYIYKSGVKPKSKDPITTFLNWLSRDGDKDWDKRQSHHHSNTHSDDELGK